MQICEPDWPKGLYDLRGYMTSEVTWPQRLHDPRRLHDLGGYMTTEVTWLGRLHDPGDNMTPEAIQPHKAFDLRGTTTLKAFSAFDYFPYYHKSKAENTPYCNFRYVLLFLVWEKVPHKAHSAVSFLGQWHAPIHWLVFKRSILKVENSSLTLKEHVALDRTSWSIKSACNRFLIKCIWLERCFKSRI